jgi:hypothetical protein
LVAANGAATKCKTFGQIAVGVAMSFGIGLAAAQERASGAVVTIGVLTDLSGLYSDIAGQGVWRP